MKPFLRFRGQIRPEKQRSTISYQLPAMSYQSLDTGRWLITIFQPFDKPKASSYLRPFLLLILVFVSCGAALAQELVGHTAPAAQAENIRGIVVSAETGEPLEGATVKIKNANVTTLTNKKGGFSLITNRREEVLEISFLGYETQKFSFANTSQTLTISLEPNEGLLEEVMVSTGYQEIPKERATGSFVQIDNELLNRNVGSNILDRLDGVTSGLTFNRNLSVLSNNSAISIRGRSTIFADSEPLIVLDNFPYDGDLNNINPNDIENITVLKDASAASIWGVRAGNGVIVMTTKKGKADDKINVSFQTNTTVTNRLDLHYLPQMSSSEYIDLEQYLFEQGYYNNTINNGYGAISPAIEMLLQKRNGAINSSDFISRINELKAFDVRNDLEKHIYRKAVNQQYSLSIKGGSSNHTYFISSGYDKNLHNQVSSNYERFTLNLKNNYAMLANKLEISSGILLTRSETRNAVPWYDIPFTPYDRLVDDEGNHLAVITSSGLRKQYTDTAGNGKLLNWDYRPLDELDDNRSYAVTDYKLNAILKYNILPSLNITVNYQYQNGINDNEIFYKDDSYYVRNLVNSYTQLNYDGQILKQPIPFGAILQNTIGEYRSNYGRGQINMGNRFGDKHDINAIAGIELRDRHSTSKSNGYYGYDASTASFVPMDYLTNFPIYYSSGTSRIFDITDRSFSIDKFRSVFFNASYVYDDRYLLSASARRDESNIFGVKANQKGVPLWSIGVAWQLNQERFYHFVPLPLLKAKITFGYNGNLDRSSSAYLTAQNRGQVNEWRANFSNIVNPPNPSLRWERVQNINAGIEFATKGNLISGNLEYFIKQGLDLIGNSPIAPQTGITEFRGNSAETRTSGVDFMINKNELKATGIKWRSNFLFSYNKETITAYTAEQGSNSKIVKSNYLNPLEGYPYNAVFSFKSMGLSEKGMALGMFDGKISDNYSAILNSKNVEDLIFHGSSTPLIYGGWRNTFYYGSWDISFNITYKLNYYFRRARVFSGSNFDYRVSDYDKRWQSPGDEQNTVIPVLTYPINSAQNNFFQSSNVLVERADHIRLVDVRLSYNLEPSWVRSTPFKNMQVYMYANNIGLLWKATHQDVDPDFTSAEFITPRSLSVGLNINF